MRPEPTMHAPASGESDACYGGRFPSPSFRALLMANMERRQFLKVAGVTGAAASSACSSGGAERLIPYVVPAEEIVPGVPTLYSSTCRECPAGCGIHIETHEGRVTKVEGNPAHPISQGNLCARGQASVQGLYHPDRYQGPFTSEPGVRTTDVAWRVAERLLAEKVRELQAAGQASGIVMLTQNYTGSMAALADAFVAAAGGRRVVYDPWADQPRDLNFADADLLVSFGADFLETWGSPVEYARQFAQMRSVRNGRRGKFVWVGPHRPLTGLNADQWIAPRPGTEVMVARAISGSVDTATAAQQTGVAPEVLAELARDFNAGWGVALGPGAATAGTNAAELQAAISALNGAGASVVNATRLDEVARLTEQMRRGEIGMLLVDSANPAYTLPGGLRFAEAMEQVPTCVSFSSYPDETSLLCTMVLPDHHFLESWGDYQPRPGLTSLVQPGMRPVFNTRQTGDVLISVANQLGQDIAGGANSFYDYLRAEWGGRTGSEQGWRDTVVAGGMFPGVALNSSDAPALSLEAQGVPGAPPQAEAGVVAASAAAAAPVAPAVAPAAAVPPRFEPVQFEGAEDARFNLVVYPSYRFFDGRTANRPWLLELPDPVTKVSWQSWVEMHPQAARELELEQGDVVEVVSPFGRVAAPVYLYAGVRPDTVAIQTGLGHRGFGRYTEDRGVNPNVLLGNAADARSGAPAPYGVRVAVRPTGAAELAGPPLFEQGVRVQHDREIAQAISLAQLARATEAGNAKIPGEDSQITTLRGNGGFAPITSDTDPASYPPGGTKYGQYVEGTTRWAMTVDLSRCTGCSACVTACYAENNIPVVGPDEVRKGRELSWLRIERYFGVEREGAEEYRQTSTDTDDVRFLPMMCQQCGNAPCEPVCPVYAAYHTPDGLNAQVYNRCVGTRYCANNCPYKVRYYNWFTYDFPAPLNWQLNPDVTVREKGVMEKCTFCVQRIREVERNSAREGRTPRDGEITPACVQTCPTQVFVFGNIADPDSEVARAARSVRSYRSLEPLNTQPGVVYLKKVTLHEPAQGGHHAPETAEAEAH